MSLPKNDGMAMLPNPPQGVRMSKLSRAYQYDRFLSNRVASVPESIASMSIDGTLPKVKRKLKAWTGRQRTDWLEEPLLESIVKKWDHHLSSTMPPLEVERLQEASWRQLEEEATRSMRAATHRSSRRARPPVRSRKSRSKNGAVTAREPRPEGAQTPCWIPQPYSKPYHGSAAPE